MKGERRFYEFGAFRLDVAGRLLFRDGEALALAPKVIDTLLLLVENAGSVVGKEDLLKQVWEGAIVEEGSVTRTISVLRKALGSSEEGQEFIATIPRRGYRLVVPVRVIEGETPTPPVSPPVLKPSKHTHLIRIVSGIALLLVLAYFSAHYLWSHHSQPGRQMIAVLPFQNLTGDASKDFVSDGLTEEMITQLGELNPQRLGVIARTSAMTYKGNAKPIAQVGQELGVQYILEGSVRGWGDRVRISAQLIQVSDQTHLWAENYDRTPRDILALQSDVSQAIAREIRIKLAPGREGQLAGAHPVTPEAYEAYLKGRYFWNKRTTEGLNKGVGFFDQALQIQPDYTAAYIGLSDSYLMLAGRGFAPVKEALPKAKAAALKALEIDQDSGEVHASLAHIRLHDWDWEGLEDEFKRAIELNPANAYSYYYYSEYLESMGRAEESIAMIRKVQEIDPVSPVLSTTVASQQYHARKYDDALAFAQKARELYPDYFMVHFRLGEVYTQKRMGQQAIEEMQKAVLLSGRSTEMLAGLAQAYAVAGMKAQAQQMLDELSMRAKSQYVSPYYVAKVYGSLGDKENAFIWLEKAYQDHSFDLIELKIEPCFDDFHSDSRFSELLYRIGWRNLN